MSYRDIWGTFKNLMDYIEFFDMGTPKSLLKKSANEWLGTNHELSRKSDKIKREHARELKRIFQIFSNSMFWETFEKLDLDAGDATWLHQSCCCDHCVNHLGIDLCDCGSEHKVGECECGSQKAHDTLGIKYDSFGAILKNFG